MIIWLNVCGGILPERLKMYTLSYKLECDGISTERHKLYILS